MATKVMALRRDDACSACSVPIPAGAQAQWDSAAKAVRCLDCAGQAPKAAVRPEGPSAGPPLVEPVDEVQPEVPPPLDIGDPGRSAREEYVRRHAKREARIEQKWGTGRLGKVAKFLSDDPQTTTAWAKGARGEMLAAQVLADRLGDRAVLLHDRRVPGTRGNIDHLAIASSGVWVIDAKKYTGKVEQRDVGGWFKSDVRLYVKGRDQTKKVGAMTWQVEAVTNALGSESVPVHPALSFVGAEWPLFFAKPLKLQGVWISWPTKLAELIATEGPLSPDDIDRVARILSVELPSK